MKHFKSSNNPSEIFVFGANLAGFHGVGAALEAYQNWGAKFGEIGRTGQAYGIPTKERNLRVVLDLDTITHYVGIFLDYAKAHPELTFLVTPIGTGFAGYNIEEIAPMFTNAPENCILAWKE